MRDEGKVVELMYDKIDSVVWDPCYNDQTTTMAPLKASETKRLSASGPLAMRSTYPWSQDPRTCLSIHTEVILYCWKGPLRRNENSLSTLN